MRLKSIGKIIDNKPVCRIGPVCRGGLLYPDPGRLASLDPGRRVASGCYRIRLRVEAGLCARPGWPRSATPTNPFTKITPGQFVHLRVSERKEILLRRPFSIYNIIDKSRHNIGIIEVLYRVVGKGTRFMATLRPGEKIDVLGPLGNGFKVNHRARISILVAGGMGVAGLHLLLKQLVDKSTAQHKIYTLIGARSREGLYILDTYRQLPSSARLIATEDGSKGVKGLVTMLLEELLSTQLPSDTEDILRTKCITRVPRPVTQVYACGPEGMLKEVCRIAQTRAIPCQVSLERQMGCGLGICRACVCKVKDGETVRYATVCSDGPVFEAGQIVY